MMRYKEVMKQRDGKVASAAVYILLYMNKVSIVNV